MPSVTPTKKELFPLGRRFLARLGFEQAVFSIFANWPRRGIVFKRSGLTFPLLSWHALCRGRCLEEGRPAVEQRPLSFQVKFSEKN